MKHRFMDSSGNWNFPGSVISNPMRNKQNRLLYSINQPVLNAAFNAAYSVLKAGLCTMDYSATSIQKYQNNYKSNSSPAIDKTG